ncbi:CCR4-NOT transcription complex subunit, putative [Pediculus humanus corporis]|uniref:2',5'-phosphodiesterase 12 n=1 Tax=Pediculus humanus subsp. corporis TaxID=121224 RepID=E0VBW5_PEDHC|nr:CCR4-NOT transcription complex subunit, putative [Pediculus humanus corporis]EEB10871.1 CCR4-NOT transcription complex subunit, putative [Pediculus humanus corporis]
MKSIFFHLENPDKVQIQLFLNNDVPKITKVISFQRNLSENLGKFLIKLNGRVEDLVKKSSKSGKKDKTNDDNNSINVIGKFFSNDEPISDELTFQNMFEEHEKNKITLNILGVDYNAFINWPYVSVIKPPKEIKVGCPTSPSEIVILSGDLKHSNFKWYKKLPHHRDWIYCEDNFFYTPKEEDIGYNIKLVCIPKSENKIGSEYHVDCPKLVTPFNETELIKKRHEFTKSETKPEKIRVVCYNILADTYTNTKEAKNSIFAYCNSDALDLENRKRLLLTELTGYNSDIICLQEVDKKLYDTVFLPFCNFKNFNSVYNKKEGFREGCAMFYKKSKFEFIDHVQYLYAVELKNNKIFKNLKEIIYNNNKLVTRLNSLQTLLQVVVLKSLTSANDYLVVGNTHLYFHPDADHIRLLQGIMGFDLLNNTANELKRKLPDINVSIIFCGDFNSTPDCGVYKYITEGYIEGSEIDWKSNLEEAVDGYSANHSVKMISACGTPEFTNYTKGFKACLDYIYFQNNRLELESFVPFPSLDDLSREVALPSTFFPSDHVALIADLKWKC